jgi:3-hydroxybutyryl-CoA dehydrogenase
MADFSRVAVIGAGTMGNGIAHVFAQNGHDVVLIDVSAEALERALGTIGKNLDRQVKKGAVSEEEKRAALDAITTSTELEAAADVGLVVEAATERRDLKFAIFRKLDEVCREGAILATNTSSISITEYRRRVTSRPDKVIGMHFMNPVPVMKLVEVIRGLPPPTRPRRRRCSWRRRWGRRSRRRTTTRASWPTASSCP